MVGRVRLGSLAVLLGKAGSQVQEASVVKREVVSREVTVAKVTGRAGKALVERKAVGKVAEREARRGVLELRRPALC